MQKFFSYNLMPLEKEQLDSLQLIFSNLSNTQLIWIAGYLWGLANSNKSAVDHVINNNIVQQSCQKGINVPSTLMAQIVIISASQTGNARRLAEQLRDNCITANLNVVLFHAGDFAYKKISAIRFLIIIISTYGEGEPPEEAISLYDYLFSKRALSMEKTCFAIFSLGDRSYKYFAKAGKDLDNRLEELGACRLCERIDADLDFQDTADIWMQQLVRIFQEQLNINVVNTHNHNISNVIDNQQKIVNYCKDVPFVACVSVKQKITSRSSLKDVHHLEIDITNSHLIYTPGDALGVWYENDVCLVHEILKFLHLAGNEQVEVKGKCMLLSEALCHCYELTKNMPVVVKRMAIVTKSKMLLDLLSDNNVENLHKFCITTPIIEMIRCVSMQLSPQDLLTVLCPMTPRFYSISSAQVEVGIGEVHITVGAVRYKINNCFRTGSASGYLIDRLQENDNVRVFIASNKNFRLPTDFNTAIVMIGSGTGIAPFRAFIQQRAADGAVGKNWLFFGNVRFIDDFLYQTEWQRYVKDGLLNKINTAWSRDQDNKIYVQNKLLQNSCELWSWIQEGAHVYVCGDANRMARDVEQALIALTSQHGGMNMDTAKEFWHDMRIQHRYQRDVY